MPTTRAAFTSDVAALIRRNPRLRAAARELGLGRLAGRLGLRPAPRPKAIKDVRLVPDPVFVLTCTRSGSTLLRLLLNSHSQIRAPHELQLNSFKVSPSRKGRVGHPMEEMGVSFRDLENMLWDHILYAHLATSGKQIVVDKTPQNMPDWKRIADFWPQARYIHLRRHPAAIYDSRRRWIPDESEEAGLRMINDYGRHLNDARAALPGPTIRYEDLTARPEETLREICGYLGVRFEPAMLDYDTGRRAGIVHGLGDMGETVMSGQVRGARPVPSENEIPEQLRELCRQWGYLQGERGTA